MRNVWMMLMVVVLLAMPANSQAHMFWLLADQETPAVGGKVQVEVGFGHKFPKDEDIKEERLGAVTVRGADGKEVALKKISTSRYEFAPPAEGFYVIKAQMVPGFVTRTREGMKMQSKKGIPDANLCFRFDMAAKTIIKAGNPKEGSDRQVQSSLEIVPRKDPQMLKSGEVLPVQVLFQGKPVAGVEILATYDSWNDKENPFAVKGKSGSQGEFELKLDKGGKWLIVATHKTPYHDETECDENLYKASLTFGVR